VYEIIVNDFKNYQEEARDILEGFTLFLSLDDGVASNEVLVIIKKTAFAMQYMKKVISLFSALNHVKVVFWEDKTNYYVSNLKTRNEETSLNGVFEVFSILTVILEDHDKVVNLIS